jgi:hypothetical protein
VPEAGPRLKACPSVLPVIDGNKFDEQSASLVHDHREGTFAVFSSAEYDGSDREH